MRDNGHRKRFRKLHSFIVLVERESKFVGFYVPQLRYCYDGMGLFADEKRWKHRQEAATGEDQSGTINCPTCPLVDCRNIFSSEGIRSLPRLKGPMMVLLRKRLVNCAPQVSRIIKVEFLFASWHFNRSDANPYHRNNTTTRHVIAGICRCTCLAQIWLLFR